MRKWIVLTIPSKFLLFAGLNLETFTTFRLKNVFWKKCLLAIPSRREMWCYQAGSSKGLWRWWWAFLLWGKTERAETAQPGEKAQGVSSDQMQPGASQWQDQKQWAQAETKEIPPKLKKMHFFTVTEPWHWLSREAGESLSLGLFRSCLDTAQDASSGWPCLTGWFGPEDLQRSLPTSTILWFHAFKGVLVY